MSSFYLFERHPRLQNSIFCPLQTKLLGGSVGAKSNIFKMCVKVHADAPQDLAQLFHGQWSSGEEDVQWYVMVQNEGI